MCRSPGSDVAALQRERTADKLHVLIADDHPDMVLLLRKVVERYLPNAIIHLAFFHLKFSRTGPTTVLVIVIIVIMRTAKIKVLVMSLTTADVLVVEVAVPR